MTAVDPLLCDLYGHQAWADAEHWRAFEACPPALADPALRERLHHIHHVQSAFLWVVSGGSEPFTRSTPADFPTAESLKAYARAYHERAARLLESLGEARLQELVSIPWFKDPPLRISVAEALLQCAMHSQNHRGQNATRLRELGGKPPTTDLIQWWWKGRPAPDWS